MAQTAGNLIGTLATLSCQIIELSLNSKRYLEQMDVKTLNNIEMQGTVITSINCSAQRNTMGKECLATGDGLFKYKGCLAVPPLALVDDVLAVSECGVDSVKLNAIVNSKMASKKLELGHKKCFQIHVGIKTQKMCSFQLNKYYRLSNL